MSKSYVKKVIEVSWHRNGICGRGFYAVRFLCDVDEVSEGEAEMWNLTAGEAIKDAEFLAVLTDDPGECYVICTDLLKTRGVRFGANSWRGDNYEPELRKAIEEMNSSGSTRVGPFGIPT